MDMRSVIGRLWNARVAGFSASMPFRLSSVRLEPRSPQRSRKPVPVHTCTSGRRGRVTPQREDSSRAASRSEPTDRRRWQRVPGTCGSVALAATGKRGNRLPSRRRRARISSDRSSLRCRAVPSWSRQWMTDGTQVGPVTASREPLAGRCNRLVAASRRMRWAKADGSGSVSRLAALSIAAE